MRARCRTESGFLLLHPVLLETVELRHRRSYLPAPDRAALSTAWPAGLYWPIAKASRYLSRQVTTGPSAVTGAVAVEALAVVEQAAKRAEVNALYGRRMIRRYARGVTPDGWSKS